MKKFKVTVQAEIIVEFDENSEEFKEVFQGYKEIIDENADFESLSESIASQISRYGVSDMIEGIGYVKNNGKNQFAFEKGEYTEQVGHINVITETDLNGMVDFDIFYIEELNDNDSFPDA